MFLLIDFTEYFQTQSTLKMLSKVKHNFTYPLLFFKGRKDFINFIWEIRLKSSA